MAISESTLYIQVRCLVLQRSCSVSAASGAAADAGRCQTRRRRAGRRRHQVVARRGSDIGACPAYPLAPAPGPGGRRRRACADADPRPTRASFISYGRREYQGRPDHPCHSGVGSPRPASISSRPETSKERSLCTSRGAL
jgi:hypothetical protein